MGPSPQEQSDADATANVSLYPESPTGFERLSRPSSSYRLRVVLVLLSLFAFLLLYLALLAFAAYLVYLTTIWVPATTRGLVWAFKLGAIFGAAMLFLFLLKGLFKRSSENTDHMVCVSESEQPEIFDFVRRLCAEGKSPFPKSVYLSPDVNAAVFYPRSLFSLVLPVRKNLLIGLGLTNVLNLSEFKAVLAHEFGHFSQSSMKLGQYVYVANQVVADMIFGRDRWDDLLETWRQQDLRISLPAWVLSAIVWVLRHLLGLVFKGINVLNFSLSRQMEFNADLHACRLTGSDAIVSGLWKVERGSLAFQVATNDLVSAAHHGRYSTDIFHHQSRALAKLDSLLEKDQSTESHALRQPYQYGPKLHFKPTDTQQPSMWSTHPPNHEREANLKRRYVAAEPDEREAWALFHDLDALKDRVGVEFYKGTLGIDARELRTRIPATEIDALIEEEAAEAKQAEHYHGLYDNRVLRPGKIHEASEEIALHEKLGTLEVPALRSSVARWRGTELAGFMKAVNELEQQGALLSALVQAARQTGQRSVQRDGEVSSVPEVERRLEELGRTLEAKRGELEKADEAVFRYFYAAGDATQRADLLRRYGFLLEIQAFIEQLLPIEQEAQAIARFLQSGQRPTQENFEELLGLLSRGTGALHAVNERGASLLTPALSNIAEDTTVSSFVFRKRPPECPTGGIEGPWLRAYFEAIQSSLDRLRMLHFKNLGHLLRLQEAIDPRIHGVEHGGEAAA